MEPMFKEQSKHSLSEDEFIGSNIHCKTYRIGLKPNYYFIGASLLHRGSGVKLHVNISKSKKQEMYFLGSDAINWISTHLNTDQNIAVSIACKLLALGMFRASDSGNNRFENDPNTKYLCYSNRTLNNIIIWDRPSLDLVNTSCTLLKTLCNTYTYYAPLFRKFEIQALEICKQSIIFFKDQLHFVVKIEN